MLIDRHLFLEQGFLSQDNQLKMEIFGAKARSHTKFHVQP